MQTESELAELADCHEPARRFAAGTEICGQGEPVRGIVTLLKGWVCCYQVLPDGRRQILDFLNGGSVLVNEPEQAYCLSYGIIALTDVAICTLRRERFSLLSRRYPKLTERCFRLAKDEVRAQADFRATLGCRSAAERITYLLLSLFVKDRGRLPCKEDPVAYLPITQALMADALGLTAVHVNRTLRILREMGVLTFKEHKVEFLSPARAMECAGIDETSLGLWLHEPPKIAARC